MARNVRYTPDRAGMRALAQSGGISDACYAAATRGMNEAGRIAPIDTGEYAGSFRVRRETVRAGRDNEPRAGAVLENVAPHAIVVELRDHVLARVVDVIEGP